MAYADTVTARRVLRSDPIADTFVPADTVSVIARIRTAATDNFAPTDTATGLFRMRGSASDSFAPSDTASALFRFRARFGTRVNDEQPQDDDCNKDSLSARFVYRAAFSTTAPFNDVVEHLLPNISSATPLSYSDLADSFNPSDAVSGLMRHRGSASDDVSSTLSDGTLSMIGMYLATLEDSFAPTDTASALLPYRASFSESATWNDIVNGTLLSAGSAVPLTYSDISDSFVPTDSVSGLFRYFASMGTSFAPLDAVGAINRLRAALSDAITPTDIVSFVAPGLASIGDNLTWADAVTALGRYLAGANDATTPSDLVEGFFRHFGSLADVFIPADDFLGTLSDGTLGIMSYSFGDLIALVDALSIRGWGITANKSCTPITLIGPDGRAIRISGDDDTSLKLRTK
jgi:hypothetical protein